MSPANYLVSKNANTMYELMKQIPGAPRAQQCALLIQMCELITPKYLNEMLDKDNPKYSRKSSIKYAIALVGAFDRNFKILFNVDCNTNDEEVIDKALNILMEKSTLIKHKLYQVYYDYYVELPIEECFDADNHEKFLQIVALVC